MKTANLIIRITEVLNKEPKTPFEITEDDSYVTIIKETFYSWEIEEIIKILKGKHWWVTDSRENKKIELNISKRKI